MMNWHKPPLSHFKLNVDGSKSHSGIIGAGGVIRNSFGEWIHGFTHHIGVGNVLQAEMDSWYFYWQ